jgi:hypothetical protein
VRVNHGLCVSQKCVCLGVSVCMWARERESVCLGVGWEEIVSEKKRVRI